MINIKNILTIIIYNYKYYEGSISLVEDKNLEIRINSEGDKEIKFSRGFKFLLVIGSILTSIYAIVLIVILCSLIGEEKVNIYNVVFVRD